MVLFISSIFVGKCNENRVGGLRVAEDTCREKVIGLFVFVMHAHL